MCFHGHDHGRVHFQALKANTTGGNNTASGVNALFRNTIGGTNTAIGRDALLNNTTGGSNIALGFSAGSALNTGSNNIAIGNVGVAGEANTTRLGKVQTRTFIAGISGVGVTGTAVLVKSDGQLGVASSSERFKDAIAPMDGASAALLALKPVTFRYKSEIDPAGTPQYGLIAEQVAAVNPDWVVRDAEGQIFTVRYEAVNAMLLNEFLKEHRKVEKLEAAMTAQAAINAAQQAEIQALAAGLKEQVALIQKVSEASSLSRSAPQVAASSR